MKDYLYDGTFDGYLTAIFYAYSEKKEVHIYKEQTYSPSLLATSQVITYEVDKADRVYESIRSKLSWDTLKSAFQINILLFMI